MLKARIYIVLLLLGGIFASHASVLCTGVDGHTAIEPAGHDHCGGNCEQDADDHFDNGMISSVDNCHHCTDTPLLFEAVGVGRKNIETHLLVILNLQQPVNHAQLSATQKIGEESSFLYSFPPPLRNIVLLI